MQELVCVPMLTPRKYYAAYLPPTEFEQVTIREAGQQSSLDLYNPEEDHVRVSVGMLIELRLRNIILSSANPGRVLFCACIPSASGQPSQALTVRRCPPARPSTCNLRL